MSEWVITLFFFGLIVWSAITGPSALCEPERNNPCGYREYGHEKVLCVRSTLEDHDPRAAEDVDTCHPGKAIRTRLFRSSFRSLMVIPSRSRTRSLKDLCVDSAISYSLPLAFRPQFLAEGADLVAGFSLGVVVERPQDIGRCQQPESPVESDEKSIEDDEHAHERIIAWPT